VTWKTYPVARQQAARVCAAKVRCGKVKPLNGLTDDADVQRHEDAWVVTVRRSRA